jgi:hypothetical protein
VVKVFEVVIGVVLAIGVDSCSAEMNSSKNIDSLVSHEQSSNEHTCLKLRCALDGSCFNSARGWNNGGLHDTCGRHNSGYNRANELNNSGINNARS